VELLIKSKADTTAKAQNGWTPLHLASMNGHTSIAVVLMWGDKEHMTNCADSQLGLDTFTGDGSVLVPGLSAPLVASCHLNVKTQAQITAAMLRIKDEATRRAMEKKEKKKKPVDASGAPKATGSSSGTPKEGNSPSHSKSPTRERPDKKANSPPQSRSPARKR